MSSRGLIKRGFVSGGAVAVEARGGFSQGMRAQGGHVAAAATRASLACTPRAPSDCGWNIWLAASLRYLPTSLTMLARTTRAAARRGRGAAARRASERRGAGRRAAAADGGATWAMIAFMERAGCAARGGERVGSGLGGPGARGDRLAAKSAAWGVSQAPTRAAHGLHVRPTPLQGPSVRPAGRARLPTRLLLRGWRGRRVTASWGLCEDGHCLGRPASGDFAGSAPDRRAGRGFLWRPRQVALLYSMRLARTLHIDPSHRAAQGLAEACVGALVSACFRRALGGRH